MTEIPLSSRFDWRPYYDENQFAIEVEKYREISPGAYGLLVSDKNERVEIRGPNKIKKKVN